jgi:hypothetical protein
MSVSSIPSPARVKVVQGIRSLFSSAETVSLEALVRRSRSETFKKRQEETQVCNRNMPLVASSPHYRCSSAPMPCQIILDGWPVVGDKHSQSFGLSVRLLSHEPVAGPRSTNATRVQNRDVASKQAC